MSRFNSTPSGGGGRGRREVIQLFSFHKIYLNLMTHTFQEEVQMTAHVYRDVTSCRYANSHGRFDGVATFKTSVAVY